MTDNTLRTLRLDTELIQRWLDRLDAQSRAPAGLDSRRSRRFTYRSEPITVDISDAEDSHTRYQVVPRNISREGMGFLVGQFLYPRSRCRLTLTGQQNRQQPVTGYVTRCRYLVGSGALHEAGVVFDRPIDVALFAPHSRLVRVMLIDQSSAGQALIRRFLVGAHADLACAKSAGEARRLAATGEFDLIILDWDDSALEAAQLVRQLRETGYIGAIAALTVQAAAESRAACLRAGCTKVITKPLTRDELLETLESVVGPPLASSLATDEHLAPLIDAFVSTLRERACALAVAREMGDLSTIEHLTRSLRAEAGSYGFEVITKEAAYVEALLSAGQPPEEVFRALTRLMSLCLRARPTATPPDAAIVPRGQLTDAVATTPGLGRQLAE